MHEACLYVRALDAIHLQSVDNPNNPVNWIFSIKLPSLTNYFVCSDLFGVPRVTSPALNKLVAHDAIRHDCNTRVKATLRNEQISSGIASCCEKGKQSSEKPTLFVKL